MKDSRVTMQDIADSLGLSRNTVSKVLNGNPSVPPSTRNLVIQKAAALHYKNFAPSEKVKNGGTIAFFASMMPGKNHFGSQFLTGFTERMSRKGYTLTLYILRPEDIASLTPPVNFEAGKTAGILCIELFDPAYCGFVCAMQKPVLFADTYVVSRGREHGIPSFSLGGGRADIVMMENRTSTAVLVTSMIEKGVHSVGFIGDALHCQGFFERWEGFCEALDRAGLKAEKRYCIMDDNSPLYHSSAWLLDKLYAMGELPEAFMCANDSLAVPLYEALNRLGKSIPEDILVAGFDNVPESQLLSPRLSTVHIPSCEMGVSAADIMLRRIEDPGFPCSVTYIQTTPQFRESSGGKS